MLNSIYWTKKNWNAEVDERVLMHPQKQRALAAIAESIQWIFTEIAVRFSLLASLSES